MKNASWNRSESVAQNVSQLTFKAETNRAASKKQLIRQEKLISLL
jgi:hypothetical protein